MCQLAHEAGSFTLEEEMSLRAFLKPGQETICAGTEVTAVADVVSKVRNATNS